MISVSSLKLTTSAALLLMSTQAAADEFDSYRTPCDGVSTAVVEVAVAQAKSLAAQASAAIPPLNSDVGAKFKRWFGGPEANSAPW